MDAARFDVAIACKFIISQTPDGPHGWAAYYPPAFMPENGVYKRLALSAHDNGFRSLVPIARGDKACYAKGWTAAAKQPPERAAVDAWDWASGMGAGFAHNGDLVALDLDLDDETEINRRMAWLQSNVRGVPMIRIGRFPRMLVVYRAGEGAFDRGGDPEIFHASRQTVFFGEHPDAGRPYVWLYGSPATWPIASLPLITGEQLERFLMLFSRSGMLGSGSGRILEMLAGLGYFLDTLDDYEKAMRDAVTRHNTAVALVAYAYHQGFDLDNIDKVLRPAYLSHFTANSREHHQRFKDFNGILLWVREKVPPGKKATSFDTFVSEADGIYWEAYAMSDEDIAHYHKEKATQDAFARAALQAKVKGKAKAKSLADAEAKLAREQAKAADAEAVAGMTPQQKTEYRRQRAQEEVDRLKGDQV